MLHDMFKVGLKRLVINLEYTNLTVISKKLFGFGKDQNLTPGEEQYILENIIVSPNNVAFVKRSVREGILPRMLSEVLNTRIMIKKSMKIYDPKKS